jgi:hypothetical protein
MYELFYEEQSLGTVTTNHSISIDEAIELLSVDIDEYEDFDGFRLECIG